MTTPGHAKTCPVCSKPASERHRPFCSERCANIDLHRWLTGRYAIPTDEAPPDVTDRGRNFAHDEQD